MIPRTPGQRLAAAIGFAGKDGYKFQELVKQVVEERRGPMTRRFPKDVQCSSTPMC